MCFGFPIEFQRALVLTKLYGALSSYKVDNYSAGQDSIVSKNLNIYYSVQNILTSGG
jgi:hypothetical protein